MQSFTNTQMYRVRILGKEGIQQRILLNASPQVMRSSSTFSSEALITNFRRWSSKYLF